MHLSENLKETPFALQDDENHLIQYTLDLNIMHLSENLKETPFELQDDVNHLIQ